MFIQREYLANIFSRLRVVLNNLEKGINIKINGINLYANIEGTYFTANIDKKEIPFLFFDDSNNNFKDINISEREELLIIDAFEDLYEVLYEKQNCEKSSYEKVVDDLFLHFLQRRKHKGITTKLKYGTRKIYI